MIQHVAFKRKLPTYGFYWVLKSTKLFYGCPLPIIEPPNQFYLPIIIGKKTVKEKEKTTNKRLDVLQIPRNFQVAITALYFSKPNFNYKTILNLPWEKLGNAVVFIFDLHAPLEVNQVALIFPLNTFLAIKHLPLIKPSGFYLSNKDNILYDLRMLLINDDELINELGFKQIFSTFRACKIIINGKKVKGISDYCSRCKNFFRASLQKKCSFCSFNCSYPFNLNFPEPYVDDLISYLEEKEEIIYANPCDIRDSTTEFEPLNFLRPKPIHEKCDSSAKGRALLTKRLNKYCCNYCMFNYKKSSYSWIKPCGFYRPIYSFVTQSGVKHITCGGPYIENEFTWEEFAKATFDPRDIQVLANLGKKIPKNRIEELLGKKLKYEPRLFLYLKDLYNCQYIYLPNKEKSERIILESGANYINLPYSVFCKIAKLKPVETFDEVKSDLVSILKKYNVPTNASYPAIAALNLIDIILSSTKGNLYSRKKTSVDKCEKQLKNNLKFYIAFGTYTHERILISRLHEVGEKSGTLKHKVKVLMKLFKSKNFKPKMEDYFKNRLFYS